jgi:serine/threonine protein kinase
MSYTDRKLGDYRIVAKIGHGAMAEMYRAHDERNNRDVELRVFSDGVFTDESSFQKFRNEVLTLAQLNHPNVQSVFEFGRHAGVDFLATELVLGQTVSKKLEEGPLPEPEIFSLGKQLAEGLAAAHKQGVVHRDLKSSSLMVTPEGRLKIRDFLEAPGFESPRQGAIVGTLAYMSPEKLRGQPDDARSDIYAAGVVLYEMATSRTPFAQRENADVMRAIINETPAPPHSLNPNVSPPLEAVIARSLDKDPTKRFGSAREMSIALLFAESPIAGATAVLATSIHQREGMSDSKIKELIEKAREQQKLRDQSLQRQRDPASPARAEKEPPIKIKADDSFDPVHFAVTCSHTVAPASSFVLNVWAYLQIHQGEVERQAKNALGGAQPYVQSVGPSKVARGTVLSVSLRIDELTADALEGTILWDGEIGNVTFSISVPNGISRGIKSGFATVHVGSLRIAAIHFFITIGRKATSSDQVFSRGVHRTAFASYASEDRDAVLARIQGIQKVAPKLEVFLDVLNLRSGEDWSKRLWKEIPSRDIFYLFWSESASRSNWVEKEWRCALKARGLDFIDPVPLVSPSKVPPPRELASRHFNDWVLAFMRGQQSN